MKMKRIFAIVAAMTLVITMFSGCKGKGGDTSSETEFEYYTEWEKNENKDSTNSEKNEDENTSGGGTTTNSKGSNTDSTSSGKKNKIDGTGDLIVEGLGNDSFANYNLTGNVTVSIDTSRPTDYEALFDVFQKLYPNIKLKFDYFMSPNATSAEEFLTARASAGKMPDVVFDDAGTIPFYVSQGWCYPLDDFVKNDPDFKYVPTNIVDCYRYCDKLYALPQQAQFDLILLNLDAMDALNIKEPSLSWTVSDFEKKNKKGTTNVYSGTEDGFFTVRLFSGVMSPNNQIGQYGYNRYTRKYEFDKSYNKALEFTWEVRSIPGVIAWAMRNGSSDTDPNSDYAKKFGTSNLSDHDMAFKSGKTVLHSAGTWQENDLRDSLKFDWEFWPYPQDVQGQMPMHVDHSFMTSTCQDPKAAFELLRFVSYSTEGNIARLSMYDKANKGKYSLNKQLYYPVTTSPKVAEKFNSLPAVGKVEKYLFANMSKCFRADEAKFVPEFNEVHAQYISNAQNKVTDGVAKVNEVMPEAERKANQAMQTAWANFEAKVKKAQAEFKPRH